MKAVFTVILCLVLILPAKATPFVSEHLVERIALAERIPAKLFKAIMSIESGWNGKIWPWTVNVEGKAYYFSTRLEAEKFIEKHIRQGITNIDIGCAQINWRWHGKNFTHPRELLDPETSLKYAASLLKETATRTKSWLKAALLYHSADEGFQALYKAKLVERILHKGVSA